MGAGAFGAIRAAFVRQATDTGALADERYVRRCQHHAGRLGTAIRAIVWFGAVRHAFDRFKWAAIRAGVFIDGHCFILIAGRSPAHILGRKNRYRS